MSKVLTICPENFVGVTSVFQHLAKIVGSQHYFVTQESLFLENINEGDVVIFGSWGNYYDELLKKISWIKCKKYILLTSSLGQIESSVSTVQDKDGKIIDVKFMPELDWLNQALNLLKTNQIDGLLIGSTELYEVLKRDKIHFFPYPYYWEETSNEKLEGGIGLFAPTHHRKNLLNQLAAFNLANEKNPHLELHTNSRIRVMGSIKYYEWLNKKEYFNLLSQLKVSLQCFFTESFAYSFVDSLSCNTLPIISQVIADNFELSDETVNKIRVLNNDSPTQIKKAILEITNLSKEVYDYILEKAKKEAQQKISQNNELLKKLFLELQKT